MEHNGMYYWYGEDKNGETFKAWSIMCALLEHFGYISPNLSQRPCASVKSASRSMFLKQHIAVKIRTQMPSSSSMHAHAINIW